MNSFAKMISELGEILEAPLHIEHDTLCIFKANQQIDIQIEHDPTQHRILLVAVICPIPPGKFRENVLRQALKANHNINRLGTFSYIEKTSSLAMHQYFYHVEMTGAMMAQAVADFLDTSQNCSLAIQNGQVPQI